MSSLSCVHPIRLDQILGDLDYRAATPIWTTSVSCDSRTVEKGGVFVAIEGESHDGHAHIAEAVERGCSAVVAQRPISSAGMPVCVVSDTRRAFARLCQALAGSPGNRLRTFAVTGTNGKTTTTCLLARIFAEAGNPVGLVGTLGGFDGECFRDCSLTTPPASELADWLSRMVRNECTHAVIETSSHAIDQHRLEGISLQGAVITNIQRDHLDYHRTIEAYRATKFRLFDLLSEDGVAVVNVDDPGSADMLREVDRPLLTIGMNTEAQLMATLIERCPSEQTFLLSAGSETIPVRTHMIGDHHIYNCLAAAAIGLSQGIDLPRIVKALESLQRMPGRLERIECGQPFSVYVDFAHTPDALNACLTSVRNVTEGRVICVFGAGGDRDRGKRPVMGRKVEQLADVPVLTMNDPRTEDHHQIVLDVLGGFRDPSAAMVIHDREEAIAWALAEAEPGDCVIVAGKGHERYHLIGGTAVPYNDRDTIREWLYREQPYAGIEG